MTSRHQDLSSLAVVEHQLHAVDAVSAMWNDVKSLVANEMAKVNDKMEGICQKLSTLEIKVQALEADKGTCTSEAPEEPAKRKRRTQSCLQVCQAKLAAIHLFNACMHAFNRVQQCTQSFDKGIVCFCKFC